MSMYENETATNGMATGTHVSQEEEEGQGKEVIEIKVEFDEFMFGSRLPALESLAKSWEKRDNKVKKWNEGSF